MSRTCGECVLPWRGIKRDPVPRKGSIDCENRATRSEILLVHLFATTNTQRPMIHIPALLYEILMLSHVVGLDRGIWWYYGCDQFVADYDVRITDPIVRWQPHSVHSR